MQNVVCDSLDLVVINRIEYDRPVSYLIYPHTDNGNRYRSNLVEPVTKTGKFKCAVVNHTREVMVWIEDDETGTIKKVPFEKMSFDRHRF